MTRSPSRDKKRLVWNWGVVAAAALFGGCASSGPKLPPTTHNPSSSLNPNAVSFNPKWASYGAYLHKMLEAIQTKWDRTLIDSTTYPPSGTYVEIKFRIDTKGTVDEILSINSSSSKQGESSCISAIMKSAPYGTWTPDMIFTLGDSQDITIRFYYD